MPVYLFTVHAYRSWSKDHRNGFIQHGDGLQPPNPKLASWRKQHASHPPTRFDRTEQALLHEVLISIAAERNIRLHAGSTTPSHVHGLGSMIEPLCTCGIAPYCRRDCEAKRHVEQFLTRLKQMMGRALMLHNNTSGRPYFSRGWDLTPIRSKPHFDHHVQTYLPRHAAEGGIFHRHRQARADGYSPAAPVHTEAAAEHPRPGVIEPDNRATEAAGEHSPARLSSAFVTAATTSPRRPRSS